MNTVALSPYRGHGQLTDFDRVLGRFFAPTNSYASEKTTASPSLDIVETPTHFEVKTDLPGIKEEDISISVEDRVLVIEAESVADAVEEKDRKVIVSERRTGKYHRSLKLGTVVDESAIKADFVNGVLTLTLPKIARAEVRKVAINAH